MDPKTTPLRKGDILLHGRDGNTKGVKYPGPYSGTSHANIVVEVNATNGVVKVVGGNMGGSNPGEQGVRLRSFRGVKGMKLQYDEHQDADGVMYTTPGAQVPDGTIMLSPENGKSKSLGAYIDGSILRSDSINNIFYNGNVIGNTALREYNNWGKEWTEISIEAEETMRKYYKASKIEPPQIYTFSKQGSNPEPGWNDTYFGRASNLGTSTETTIE